MKSITVLEQHPDYEPQLMNLSCHGGVTWAQPNDPPTRQGWEQWREYMLREHHTVDEFPLGDVAQDWQEEGQFIDDYEGWYRHRCETTNYIETDEPLSLVGFDCSHGGDLMPLMDRRMRIIRISNPSVFGDEPLEPKHLFHETYRDLNYVQSECRRLAQQLQALA